MINKKLITALVILFTVAGFSIYSHAAKAQTKGAQITIASQLSETINNNKIAKISIYGPSRMLAEGTEIKIISNDVVMVKSSDYTFYINFDRIIFFYLDGKQLVIHV
jgi:hypothetical protein